MAFVLYEALRTGVDNMVASCTTKVLAPAQGLYRLEPVEVLDCFVDSRGTFFGSQGRPTGLLQQVAFETIEHLLEVRNARAWVHSNFVLHLKNLTVHFGHICGKRHYLFILIKFFATDNA